MEKGKTNNPFGRPKGRPNKVTHVLRDRIQTFLEGSWLTVEKDFKELKPFERIAIYEKMLKYVIPTQKEASVKLDIEKMTDNELNLIINKILNK